MYTKRRHSLRFRHKWPLRMVYGRIILTIVSGFLTCAIFANGQRHSTRLLLSKQFSQADIKTIFSPLLSVSNYWTNHWNDVDRFNYSVFIDSLAGFLQDFIFLRQREIRDRGIFQCRFPYVKLVYACHSGELSRVCHLLRYADKQEERELRKRALGLVRSIINAYPISPGQDYAEGMLLIPMIGSVYRLDDKYIDAVLVKRLSDGDIFGKPQIPLLVILSQSDDAATAQEYQAMIPTNDRNSLSVRRMMEVFRHAVRALGQ